MNNYDPSGGNTEEGFPESSELIELDYIIVGIIRSRYPNLSEKELTVCMWTFYTMWDIKLGNGAMYEEVVARLLRHGGFTNENEINDVINELKSKRILEVKPQRYIFGRNEHTLKDIIFTQRVLYKELMSAMSEHIFTRII